MNRFFSVIFFLICLQHQSIASIDCYTILNKVHSKRALSLSADLFKTANVPFIPHDVGDFPYQYLVMNLPYTPIEKLFTELNSRFDQTLLNRGEAHITVIDPVEFEEVLKTKMSMSEINQLAIDQKIQHSTFSTLCLGTASATIKGKIEHTYFVVVKSEDLIKIRQRISDLFIQRGGDPALFNPDFYYPHITIGYTSRDLYISDGVIKDLKSCIESLTIH